VDNALRYVEEENPASLNPRPDLRSVDAAGLGLDVLFQKFMEALRSYVRLLRIVIQSLVCSSSRSRAYSATRCREGYTLMVGDDLRLSGPDDSSQTGTAFPETGTSLKDAV